MNSAFFSERIFMRIGVGFFFYFPVSIAGLFLHDSFYTFLKTLGIDDLWNTYPVELYEKDGVTRIPNYHHGFVVKQHVGFVVPPWATPRVPEDPSYGVSPMKGTWFNEAELKDDRLFCINAGPPTFRKDLKEKIEKAEVEGSQKLKNICFKLHQR